MASRGTIRVLPLPFGVGLGTSGVAVLFSSMTGLVLDDRSHQQMLARLTVVSIAAIAIGIAIARRQHVARITPAMAMSMFVAGWTGATLVAIVAFLASGHLDSTFDSLFEAVSATSTTGLTTVDDPQTLPHAIRLMRVALPWCTGFGVLVVSMGVLPAAVAGVELAPVRRLHGREKLVTTPREALKRISGLYALLTAVTVIGLRLSGLGSFDSISYGLSIASTSGMSNHADSLGHFDSFAVDAVATVGMLAAGGNLLVVWWAIRGHLGPVLQSTELRLYLTLFVLGVVTVFAAGDGLSIESAAFSVASMLSTTGLRSGDWAAAGGYPQAALIVLGGLGAMSGSLGSGFRLARVARVALEVRRRLQQLVNPARVSVLRMDGTALNEDSLKRTFGYLWMHAFTLALLAVLLNARSLDVIGTASLAVAVVSNNATYVDDSAITTTVRLSSWSEAVAMSGMMLGRLSIYPVLLTVAGVGRWLARQRPHQHAGIRMRPDA